jgi:hypothetical protein
MPGDDDGSGGFFMRERGLARGTDGEEAEKGRKFARRLPRGKHVLSLSSPKGAFTTARRAVGWRGLSEGIKSWVKRLESSERLVGECA